MIFDHNYYKLILRVLANEWNAINHKECERFVRKQ